MRYFKTTNASRQYKTGDIAVTFEPVENVGGSWSGLLAVEDDSSASKLAASNIPQITEIDAVEFDSLKKKPLKLNPSYRASSGLGQRPSNPSFRVVEVAEPGVSTSASSNGTGQVVVHPAAPSAALRSAKLEVPDELRFETGEQRRAQ